ncbi:MAG: hypothetical protein NT051_00060 [Candidatus Micrarchaeota archaeon]|nr:hypothetical protein [Candidatus Micrarchaeota archaeon]
MIDLSVQKPQTSTQGVSSSSSKLSFVPYGLPRSIAEYLASVIPGAILLLAFFVASESTVLFIDGSSMVVTFLPVICLMPILSGVVSALVLEKIRSKPITFKRGALVGAAAGMLGAFLASLLILTVHLIGKKPFGTMIDTLPMVLAADVVIILIDTVLAALGGALAAKFIKDI